MLKLLETPYHRDGEPTEAPGATGADSGGNSYSSKPPLWAAELCVT